MHQRARCCKGLKKPTDCAAFATRCTPENPLGAPMVSSEGACAAYYRYRRHKVTVEEPMDGSTSQSARISFPCPLSVPARDAIVLGHGSGGNAQRRIASRSFSARVRKPHAGAPRRSGDRQRQRLAPGLHHGFLRREAAFFPGGDIGSLAVHGTVNDLAMGGAKPLFLSVAFILEEGLPMEMLRRVVEFVP